MSKSHRFTRWSEGRKNHARVWAMLSKRIRSQVVTDSMFQKQSRFFQ
ncbi:hypothetical protein RBSH_04675 [Rhodopirellula baltica SH28]|uniref:Uncharacterized protein n=1 Tax=Rhodopirellula baltica SH28 TaxID=993517 RepID=K5C9W1_RHOBT|nr:hypothetical protein RBSH_04675 [Rhodopirellula baltica SH28]